jgi:geranylgeranyl pyrophosphate synthase
MGMGTALSANHAGSRYLVSEPTVLLKQVEMYMRASLHSAPKTAVSNSNRIQEAVLHHLQSGGQRLRARLALSAGKAVGLKEHDCIILAAIVELLHNASLIHDDLQDRDEFRRGQQTVWSKFGIDIAICCGDLFLSAAYAALVNVSKAGALGKMYKTMHHRSSEAIFGQCADLSITPDQMHLDTYIAIVRAKSGALLSLPLELVFLLSGQNTATLCIEQACKDFAVGFQIYDDLRDIDVDQHQTNGSEKERVALNIISVFGLMTGGLDTAFESKRLAKDMATDYLLRAETGLTQLPFQSGAVLSECSRNIRGLLNQFSN